MRGAAARIDERRPPTIHAIVSSDNGLSVFVSGEEVSCQHGIAAVSRFISMLLKADIMAALRCGQLVCGVP